MSATSPRTRIPFSISFTQADHRKAFSLPGFSLSIRAEFSSASEMTMYQRAAGTFVPVSWTILWYSEGQKTTPIGHPITTSMGCDLRTKHLALFLLSISKSAWCTPICGPIESLPLESIEALVDKLNTIVDEAERKSIESVCLGSYELEDSTVGEYAYINFSPEHTVRNLYAADRAYCQRHPSTDPWECGISYRNYIQHEGKLVELESSVSEDKAIKILDMMSRRSKAVPLKIYEEHDATPLEPRFLRNPTSIRLESNDIFTVIAGGNGCDGIKIRVSQVECGLENCAYEITSFCHHVALCD